MYEIRVQGVLSESWSERLSGMRIVVSTEEDNPVTLLSGHLVDQAALMGVMNTLYDLRLPILSVACISHD